MLEVKVDILGVTHLVDKYNAKGLITHFKDVLENLDKPFVFGDGLSIYLTTKYYGNRVCGVDSYLYSLSNGDYSLSEIADKDVERNWRLTLKPHIQEIVRNKFTEILGLLEDTMENILEHNNKEEAERKERKNKYRIGKVYHQQMPKGGEEGIDGYFDAEIINNTTGESTRFIGRDVFDVGTWSLPYRLNGSEEQFDHVNYTEEEKAGGKWLSEFGPFASRIRM
ncbi:hypothetical protein [Psychrobacillus sp. FJAT-21963]|uniref:hypothetical protein n=1 Tax=Psychrobacillus sp. FJAT-21963 TaxID=1712028 RepID=UPI0006FEA26F|nr:hypothetical protein [Psychrobacillus sp. FJAT-21963]KQL33347.1 hypothetical protein AN959_17450 [Psychrobacillus sp. FJAT-21963]